jgi:hypothetical protein
MLGGNDPKVEIFTDDGDDDKRWQHSYEDDQA